MNTRHYLAHSALGLVIGVTAAILWLHALRSVLPLWGIGVVAVASVGTAEYAVAAVRRRRTPRRARRRAHARPRSPRPTTERSKA